MLLKLDLHVIICYSEDIHQTRLLQLRKAFMTLGIISEVCLIQTFDWLNMKSHRTSLVD